MRQLFKERVSKFVSLLSLISLMALAALFALALPQFLISTAGRIFAAVWALTAILMFMAHARRMSVKESYRRTLPASMLLSGKKDVRGMKGIHLGRMMRG